MKKFNTDIVRDGINLINDVYALLDKASINIGKSKNNLKRGVNASYSHVSGLISASLDKCENTRKKCEDFVDEIESKINNDDSSDNDSKINSEDILALGKGPLNSDIVKSNPLEMQRNEYKKKINFRKNELMAKGLTAKDADRIITGEISIEELYDEIVNDENRERYRNILEAQYLEGYAYSHEEAEAQLDLAKTQKDAVSKRINEINKILGEHQAMYNRRQIPDDGVSDEELQKELSELKNKEKELNKQIVSLTQLIEGRGDTDFAFTSMDELDNAIIECDNEILELRIKLRQANAELHEKECFDKLISSLYEGESIENALALPIAFSYIDSDGYIVYDFDLMNAYNSNKDITILSYNDIYGNSEATKKLLELMPKGSDNQNDFNQKLYDIEEFFDENYSEFFKGNIFDDSKVESTKKELAKKAKEKNMYLTIKNSINDNVNYYFESIDPYIMKEDFTQNNLFNGDYSVLPAYILKNQDGMNADEYVAMVVAYYINDYTKNDIGEREYVDGLSINKDHLSNSEHTLSMYDSFLDTTFGGLTWNVDTGFKETSSNLSKEYSELIKNYSQKWRNIMSDSEIQVFNYICNKDGYAKGFEYLNNIKNTLDERYIKTEQLKDSEFAHDNPFLASLGSIFVKPFEGIGGFAYSMNCLANGVEMMRSRLYSSADTWRGTVSTDIRILNGDTASFFYNTGMSIGDSGLVIALTSLTGGGSLLFSTTVMGSSVYLSTLNSALDRHIDPTKAVFLSLTCSAIESLMENYSVGHLMGLEKEFTEVLNNGTIMNSLINKLTSIGVKSDVAIKTMAMGYCILDQALVEGDEELWTEVLDYFVDWAIAGDLSNRAIAIEEFKKNNPGSTDADAYAYEFGRFMDDVSQAWVGGAASGIFFGIGAGVKIAKYSNKSTNMFVNYLNNQLADLQAHLPSQAINNLIVNDTTSSSITNLTEEQSKISDEMQKFDLSKFFMNQGASTGAVGLITPAQSIVTDTFIRSQHDPSYGDHGTNVEYIYKAIYGKDATCKPSDSITFQDSVMSDGNILMQLCSDVSSIIWVPKGITNFQMQNLIKLNEQIKSIYESNPTYFDEHPMEFEIGNNGHFIECTNNLDEYIKEFDNNHYIINKAKSDEVIIGSNAQDTAKGDLNNMERNGYSLEDFAKVLLSNNKNVGANNNGNGPINVNIKDGKPIISVDFSKVNYRVQDIANARFLFGLKQSIAIGGTYYNVVDANTNESIFSEDEFNNIRSKMNGMAYYGMGDYVASNNLSFPGIEKYLTKLEDGFQDTENKRNTLVSAIKSSLDKIGVTVSTNIGTGADIELIDTGSTSRGTNMPFDSDFDFVARINPEILADPVKTTEVKNTILKVLAGDNGQFVNGQIRKAQFTDAKFDSPLEVDVTFMSSASTPTYTTDMSLKERLDSLKISDYEKYKMVVANIIYAKNMLKDAKAYKPYRSDRSQGGLGGIGVENWILQNGGSLIDASNDFIKNANGKSFIDFENNYAILDFGQNHVSVSKNQFEFDNFVMKNMRDGGFQRMLACLNSFIESYNINTVVENTESKQLMSADEVFDKLNTIIDEGNLIKAIDDDTISTLIDNLTNDKDIIKFAEAIFNTQKGKVDTIINKITTYDIASEVLSHLSSDSLKIKSLKYFDSMSDALIESYHTLNQALPQAYVIASLSSDATKIKYMNNLFENDNEKAIVISSFQSDALKIEYLNNLNDNYDKANVISSLSNDTAKLEALSYVDGNFVAYSIIISSLSNDQAKLNALKYFEDKEYENDFHIAKVINSMESENYKMIAITQIAETKHFLTCYEVAKTFETDEDKVKVLKYVTDDYYKSEIVNLLTSDQAKIDTLLLFESEYLKEKIARSLSTTEAKLEALKYIKDGFNIANVINSFETNQEKLDALKYIKTDYYKSDVICTLTDEANKTSDEAKIEALQYIDSYKYKVVKSLSSDEVIVENLNLVENDDDKLKVIKEIQSDSLKIKSLDLLGNDDYRVIVIKTLGTDKAKLESLDHLHFDIHKVFAIYSMEDADFKLQFVIDKYHNDLFTAAIINSLKTDSEKIAALSNMSDEYQISKVIKHLSSDEEKVNYISNLSNEEAILNVIISIDDINIQNELLDKYISKDNKVYQCYQQLLKNNEDISKTVRLNVIEYLLNNNYTFEQIEILSCYTGLQLAYENALDDPNITNMLNTLCRKFDGELKWTNVLEKVISSFRNDNFAVLLSDINNYTLNDTEINDLMYLLMSNNELQINSYDDLKNIDKIRENYINKLISDNTIDSIKNAYAYTTFGIDISIVNNFVNIYNRLVENADNITINDENRIYFEILKNMKNIVECEDINLLKEAMEANPNLTITPDTIASLEKVINNVVINEYNSKVYKLNEADRVDITDQRDSGYNVYLAAGMDGSNDFGLVMTSIGAYSPGMEVPENYGSAWNIKKISGHNLCTSYLNQSNLGTARIKFCCYGFSNFENGSLLSMAPYDISSFSQEESYEILQKYTSQFLTPDDMASYTRHTHNEMVFERRVINGEEFKRQPDYIVYYADNFSDRYTVAESYVQWEHTKKAAREFGTVNENGEVTPLPIVVVEREKVAIAQKKHIDQMMESFKETGNPELISDIISTYESNYSGNREYHENIVEKYFPRTEGYTDSYAGQILEYIETGLSNNDASSLELLNELERSVRLEKEKYGQIGGGLSSKESTPSFNLDAILDRIDSIRTAYQNQERSN